MPGVHIESVQVLVQASVRMATPLLIGAIGGLFSELSGVLSIQMEGLMLVGAFFGFVGAYYTHSLVWATILAMVAGALLSGVYGILSITFKAKQAVVGTACMLLAGGLTSFLNRSVFGAIPDITVTVTFQQIPIPGLSKIPFLGPIVFEQNLLVYIAYCLVPSAWFILFRTAIGLEIRSLGENPYAAASLGINPILLRYVCVLITGALGGLAGSYLSLAHSNGFIDMMSAGKGYIAFAVVVFGKYSPWGVLLASLAFGLADAFQLRVQAVGLHIPYQFLLMLPYALTFAAIMGLVGKTRRPASLGQPFEDSI